MLGVMEGSIHVISPVTVAEEEQPYALYLERLKRS